MTEFKALLLEVNSLAHQLRRSDFASQPGESLLAPGRSVLQILAEQGPQTVPAIAARQNSSRQNVQIIVNRFAAEGLVEFKPNPAHKKSGLVQITEAGLKILTGSLSREERLGHVLPAGAAESELKAATMLLRTIKEHLATTQQRPPRRELRLVPSDKLMEAALPAVAASSIIDEGTLPVNLL